MLSKNGWALLILIYFPIVLCYVMLHYLKPAASIQLGFALGLGLLIYALLCWYKQQNRQRAIDDLQALLQDRIQNQLAIIKLNADMLRHNSSSQQEKRLQRIFDSVDQVSATIEMLSEDSLNTWQGRYFKRPRSSNLSPAQPNDPHSGARGDKVA